MQIIVSTLKVRTPCKKRITRLMRLSLYLTLIIGVLFSLLGCVSNDIVKWGSLNHFDDPSDEDSRRSNCASTLDGGKPLPEGKVFAIRDIHCYVTKEVKPLPVPENMVISVIEGNNCGGRVVYRGTFGSVDGLRYSPNMPLIFGLGYLGNFFETPTVQMFRAQTNNTGRVSVSCNYVGTFERKP